MKNPEGVEEKHDDVSLPTHPSPPPEFDSNPPEDVIGKAIPIPPKWWIRNSHGYGSVTLTLLVIAFAVTTISYILSMFEKLGPVSFRQFDVGACSAYFVPLCTLYFARKHTQATVEKKP